MQTFGDHFYQFAQSIDIVTPEVYRDVLSLVEARLKIELSASTFAVVVAKLSGVDPYLVADWPPGGWWAKPVKNPDGTFLGQAAFAYGHGKPLWIVAPDKGLLTATDDYDDLLASAVNRVTIPPYERIPKTVGTRTSIILPLRTGTDIFGVMNVESARFLPYSESWHHELTMVADGIGILYRLRTANELQLECTKAAKRCLEDANFVPIVSSPTMFLASSARADKAVMKVLRAVLEEYSARFELVSWSDPQAGNIVENIWAKVASCTYGACYFSEPAEEVKKTVRKQGASTRRRSRRSRAFRDNPNVLFEAGILYALRQIKRSPIRKLLLIREADAAKIPFDLSTEFMVQIRRDKDGDVNLPHLRKELKRAISAIVEQ